MILGTTLGDETRLDLYGGRDPRDIPNYTAKAAAHYLCVPPSTVRSWVFGRPYKTQVGQKQFKPVIKRPFHEIQLLSFTNLVELHVLNAIRCFHRVSLDKVRRATAFIKENTGQEHPLANKELYTDGLDLFIDSFGEIVNVSKNGQLVMRGIIESHLDRIEWDEAGIAARLYPFTRPKESFGPRFVVINPRISFGRPVLAGTGIPTEIFAQRYIAGESIDELAMDYECERLQVEEAIRCELSQAA